MCSKMNLLDLPAEILENIAKEVRRTDSLAPLALTCSALHALVIPILYSRFEIVWPQYPMDYSKTEEVLQYGLRTLVMGKDVFQSDTACSSCQQSTLQKPAPIITDNDNNNNPKERVRRGSDYAKYTRKFLLECHWPRYYRDSGENNGTLIALAVARIIHLETFVWDLISRMPRDVWIALSSLSDRWGHECRLERVWVRWHNNSLSTRSRVTYPTLSFLPALKSLTVLDIDEPFYLEEMTGLIERSRNQLRELRIGIASQANNEDWTRPSDTLPLNSSAEWPKPGGVLEVLTGLFKNAASAEAGSTVENQTSHNDTSSREEVPVHHVRSADTVLLSQAAGNLQSSDNQSINLRGSSQAFLELDVLELERVTMSIPIMMRVMDWTKLTTLTILECGEHKKLWRALHDQYTPCTTIDSAAKNADQKGSCIGTETPDFFPLRIKHLHTDAVSRSLILFIKEAVAPNTLESVFLHEAPSYYKSPVSIDSIYRNVLRRHHSSLKRVLVYVAGYLEDDSSHLRRWNFNRVILSFISRKMPQLRELSMGIDRRDYYFFMEKLLCMTNLRALHINNIECGYEEFKDLADLAVIMAIIEPQLKLAHIRILNNRWEIVEIAHARDVAVESETDSTPDQSDESDDDDDDAAAGDEEEGIDNETDDTDSDYDSDFENGRLRKLPRLRELDKKAVDRIGIFKAKNRRL